MFEIYLDKAKKYRFRLKAKNGENICASQAYTSRSSCMKGIKSFLFSYVGALDESIHLILVRYEVNNTKVSSHVKG